MVRGIEAYVVLYFWFADPGLAPLTGTCLGVRGQHMACLKSSFSKKCVFLLVTSVRCLTFTVQNDVCPEFDTRRLFSYSSAESGKFLGAHLKSELKACTYKHDL